MLARAAVALALCAACSAEPSAPAPDAAELGLSAVAGYGRHAAVRERADVRITNTGDEAVQVVALQLRTPWFEPVPATQRPSTLPADGRPRIVPVPFGTVRCAALDEGNAEVLLTVRAGQRTVDVAVPMTDGEPGLARAHRLACAAAAVDAAAALTLGQPVVREDTADGPRLRATLRADRGGPGVVEVTQVTRSILFSVDAEQAPVLRLEAQEPSDRAEVLLTATRCDPHALTESKTSSTFRLLVRLDGGEEVATSVTASEGAGEALQALLDDTCGP